MPFPRVLGVGGEKDEVERMNWLLVEIRPARNHRDSLVGGGIPIGYVSSMSAVPRQAAALATVLPESDVILAAAQSGYGASKFVAGTAANQTRLVCGDSANA